VDLYRTKTSQKYGDVGWALVASLAGEYDQKDWPVWRDIEISDRQRAKGECDLSDCLTARFLHFRDQKIEDYPGVKTSIAT
jgi:hypothetical protein